MYGPVGQFMYASLGAASVWYDFFRSCSREENEYVSSCGKALDKIRKQAVSGEEVVLRFTPGVYHFYPNDAVEREYYISNHDQTNPKKLD